MDPIKDCPLYIELADMVELTEEYEKPVMLLDKEKRLVARNDAVEGEAFFVKFGVAAKRFMTEEWVEKLSALKTGEVGTVRLELDGGTMAEVAVFDSFYYLLPEQSAVKAENKEEIAKEYHTALFADMCERKREERGLPRTRREQDNAPSENGDEAYRLRHLSIQRLLEINEKADDTSNEKPKFFDPGEVAMDVCYMAEVELAKYGVKIREKIERADYLCYDDCEDFGSALTTLISVGVKNTEDGKVKVQGSADGERYKTLISFKCSSCKSVKNGSLPDFDELWGEYLEEVVNISKRKFWSLKVGSYAGNVVRITLLVPLSHKKSFSFLYPALSKLCYEDAVLKQINSIKWKV